MFQIARGSPRILRFSQGLAWRAAGLLLWVWIVCQPVRADLPKVDPPSSGGGAGLMDQIKGYVQDGVVLGGLVIAAIAFINVAIAAVHTFTEVRSEKATWTKFGAIVVVGVILLVSVIWLLGKSASIIL
jgi:integrating conjugative element membrane protein (TIGR03745 family)